MGLLDVLQQHQEYLILALLAVGIRYTHSPEPPGLLKLTLILSSTLFLIGISVEYLKEEVESKGLRTVLVGLLALAAPDIVQVIILAGKKVQEDPMQFIREIIDRFVGRRQ